MPDWTDHAATRMYEGAGLGPKDVDIFNPYDGYAPMAQFFLEAFQWHGVKRGDAFAFYAGDIRVEEPLRMSRHENDHDLYSCPRPPAIGGTQSNRRQAS